jgi:hypothetical protein
MLLLLLLLLAASCSSVSSAPTDSGLTGTYAGTCDAGSGQLVLAADHAFTFWVHFKDVGTDWSFQGQWSVTPPDEGGGLPDATLVDLIVAKSRIEEVKRAPQEFPDGTFFRVQVAAHEAVFSGPCTTFVLPRIR